MFVADHQTLEQLQELTRAIHQKRIWRRAQAVVLAKQGRTAQDIANALGCSLKAVKNWVAQYNAGGIEALHDRTRSGRPPLLDPNQYPRLKQRLDAPPRPEDGVWTLHGADVRQILERECGVLMSLQSVYDLLQRLGTSSLMARPQQEDANPEVQEFFKEIVVEQIQAIAEVHPEKEVRTDFEDEARFGTQGTITRVWAPKGSRPRAVRQNGREWLYVLMAVRVSTGAASALIMPELNTEVLNLFLEQFSGEFPEGGPCGADLGRGGLSQQRRSGGPEQRELDPMATVFAGVEPDGETLALSAITSLVQSRVRGQRRSAEGGGTERKGCV